MKTISFSKQVKEELAANVYESMEVQKAILAAFIRVNGSIIIRNKHTLLSLSIENAKIAKFIYKLIIDLFHANTALDFHKTNKKSTACKIIVSTKVDEIIEELDISFLEGKISKIIVFNNDTIAAYLIGVFLACGSVNSPKTSNYHLELSLNNENFAKWLSHLFGRYKNCNIEPKIIKRRDKYVLYFKKSDQIADFLVMIGAMSAAMDFENYRIDRDYANNANRLTNLDTANMSKTVSAGKTQQEDIHRIMKLGLWESYSLKAQTVMEIRLDNPSLNYEEIASIASEKLEKPITKSNVNHIFRKIRSDMEKK